MTEPIFRDVERAMDALRHHLPHYRYRSAS